MFFSIIDYQPELRSEDWPAKGYDQLSAPRSNCTFVITDGGELAIIGLDAQGRPAPLDPKVASNLQDLIRNMSLPPAEVADDRLL